MRDLGFVVHPIFEVYTEEQLVKDPEWIADSARNGWVCLCRDKLRHKAERDSVERHKGRIFRVAKVAINAELQIQFIQTNIHKIVRQAHKPGPYIYRIDRKDIERVWPSP